MTLDARRRSSARFPKPPAIAFHATLVAGEVVVLFRSRELFD